MLVIKTTEELKKYSEQLIDKKIITVDTEFIRDKTFYPKLCLLQIFDGINSAAIDPLEIMDISPILEILLNDKIKKVFHSAKQDLEIIYNLSGSIPQNISDTQILASVCGYGEAVSYAELVKNLLGVNVDKTQRYTDWKKRPLSQKQIEYAISDVSYLYEVYQILDQKLLELGRLDWVTEELDNLKKVGNYEINEDTICNKIKFQSNSKKFSLKVKELSIWRERKARALNLPRANIISDKRILELAAIKVNDFEVFLNQAKFLSIGFSEYDVLELFEILENVESIKDTKSDNLSKYQNYNPENKQLKILLKMLLRLKALEHNVCEKIIATDKTIDSFILGDTNSNLFSGWRHDLYWQFAEKIRDGKIAISYKDGDIHLISICEEKC